ncbi:DUF1810 domain-containing protein [Gemmatimonas sp.]|uniref:DUF1810 domain-containing protein n=1 Tax=Gemmatimonas sp. TaxID=1962908 RepID=UPI0037C12EDA
MNASDPFDLARFVRAQQPDYDRAFAELRAGRKRTHWMWYIFPQFVGLGHSQMSQCYAISGLPEAQAYLRHDVLGPRLLDCATVVRATEGRSAHEIFGTPDDLKFRSCATLFAQVSADPVFAQLLQQYFDGTGDPETLRRLPTTPANPSVRR